MAVLLEEAKWFLKVSNGLSMWNKDKKETILSSSFLKFDWVTFNVH